MNNNFEFVSYIPTPNDQYMLGIAKIKLYGKIELRYKHVKSKDGQGSFFCCANYTMQDPVTQEKKYVPCFLMDSRSDEDALMDAIRDGVNRVLAQRSAHAVPQPAQTAAIHYPHGMAQPKAEVAAEAGELPF